MIAIRDPDTTSNVTQEAIRELIEQRMVEMADGEEFDADINGYFLIAEPGDSTADVEQEIGCAIDRHELVEEHAEFYEVIYVPSDGDFGIVVLIPKQSGIDPELLSFCATYAVPAS